MPPEPATPILESIPQLAPDIPANAFAADNALMMAIALLAAVALLAFFIWLLWSAYHKKRTAAPPPSPEAVALAELEILRKEQLPLRACALRLSLILRHFLAGQTQDTALYETHEEFSHRIDSLSSLPESCQYDMRCLLETLAEQKYAAAGAEADASHAAELMAQAQELVQRITADQLKEAAARAKD